MGNELRKHRRQSLAHRAVLMMADKSDTRSCIIRDVSDTGGRLGVPAEQDLPETFTLLLTSVGGAKRSCRMVWREGDVVGVRFENR